MDFLPGALQGLTRVLISYPFDLSKIHMQKNKYKNLGDFYHNFLTKAKFTELYKGAKLPLIIIPIDRAIQFKYYEQFGQKYGYIISSLLCGILSCVYTIPLQYINSNYILCTEKISQSRWIFNEFKKFGLIKFYSGSKYEICRQLIASSTYLSSYGILRENVENTSKNIVFCASLSTILSWTITYPIDTIRNEIQTNKINPHEQLSRRIKMSGILNLYKGISLIYLRTIPSSAIGMLVYEYSRQIIKNHTNN